MRTETNEFEITVQADWSSWLPIYIGKTQRAHFHNNENFVKRANFGVSKNTPLIADTHG
jgi:hypothetical protein